MKFDEKHIGWSIKGSLFSGRVSALSIYYPKDGIELNGVALKKLFVIHKDVLFPDLMLKLDEYYFEFVKELEKMAKLTTKVRNKIPKTKFALPAERKYPVEDKSHAKNAKARASEMEHKGKISSTIKAKIDAKANKVLGKGKKKSK
jgi:hypothetical protein